MTDITGGPSLRILSHAIGQTGCAANIDGLKVDEK